MKCDTTDGEVRINLPNPELSKTAIIYVTKIAGSNNVVVYNNVQPETLIRTITDSDVICKFVSDGTQWNIFSDDVTPENNDVVGEIPGIGLILIDLAKRFLIPVTHNAGDLIVSDNRTQTILPVGSDGQLIFADSSRALGMKWDDMRNHISSCSLGRNWQCSPGNKGHYVKVKQGSASLFHRFPEDKNVTKDEINKVMIILDVDHNIYLSLKLDCCIKSFTPATSDIQSIDSDIATKSCPQLVTFTFNPAVDITGTDHVELQYINNNIGSGGGSGSDSDSDSDDDYDEDEVKVTSWHIGIC